MRHVSYNRLSALVHSYTFNPDGLVGLEAVFLERVYLRDLSAAEARR
jgi:hypothetical protein